MLKLQAHLAYVSGDLCTAYSMLLRYQLLRDDTSAAPTVRRMHASFVGRALRCVCDGAHVVALLRGISGSRELALRIKHDVLLVQFLEWRAALYRVLNADSFVFMVGLRELMSSRVADIYDAAIAKGALDAEAAEVLATIRELL